MDGGSYRDDSDADQPETYWRRRAITLAAGLTLLGLLIWAFSGGGGKPGHPAAAGSPAATTPAARYHSVSPEPSADASASTATAKAGADPAPAAPVAAQSGGDCSPGSVVLSLFSTQPSYSAHEFPEFDVYAVSTAAGTCTINLGPGQLHLTVMSAGRVIWDSADCGRGDGNQDDQLSRGIPVQTSITWNRAITLPGCVTLASSARPGTYQAQVRTATVASEVSTFKLVG